MHEFVSALPASPYQGVGRSATSRQRAPAVPSVSSVGALPAGEVVDTAQMVPQSSLGAGQRADVQAMLDASQREWADHFAQNQQALFAALGSRSSAPLQQTAFIPPGAPGLHSSMQQHFAPPQAYSIVPYDLSYLANFTLKDHAGLKVFINSMDAAWTAQWGCPDLAPPPRSSASERWAFPIRAFLEACGLAPLPGHNLDDPRQMGGDECEACMALAMLRGLPRLQFYMHPLEAAQRKLPAPPDKPKGLHHRYVHSLGKCQSVLACLHCLVRADRDSGKPESEQRTHLLCKPVGV